MNMRKLAAPYAQSAAKIAQIEPEMNRIGFWRAEPLPESAYAFRQAFAMDTMTFGQWLQFIFVPRVKSIIGQRGEFPTSSQVGVQAIREFDGDPQADRLVSLLCEFDALFNQSVESSK
jgi:uncharacterized protein YqcC (DUF446 family)